MSLDLNKALRSFYFDVLFSKVTENTNFVDSLNKVLGEWTTQISYRLCKSILEDYFVVRPPPNLSCRCECRVKMLEKCLWSVSTIHRYVT